MIQNGGILQQTKESFDHIQPGMSYSEVVSIVGDPTETSVDSESDLGFAKLRITIYTWYVNDSVGANFNVTFENGKVVSKAQAGLK